MLMGIPLSGSTSTFMTLMVVSFCNWIFTAPSSTFFLNRSTICHSKQSQLGAVLDVIDENKNFKTLKCYV